MRDFFFGMVVLVLSARVRLAIALAIAIAIAVARTHRARRAAPVAARTASAVVSALAAQLLPLAHRLLGRRRALAQLVLGRDAVERQDQRAQHELGELRLALQLGDDVG